MVADHVVVTHSTLLRPLQTQCQSLPVNTAHIDTRSMTTILRQPESVWENLNLSFVPTLL